MGRGHERTLHAADVFRRWCKMVAAAEDEIIIFSPYLDALVGKLLAKSALPASAKHVVTDLSPASGVQDYLGQLRALKSLAEDGVDVRTLPRLHAKVLLCDGITTSLGSQNFTTYARKSREATALPATTSGEATFLATVRDWFDQSEGVEPALLERLLAALADRVEEADEAHQQVVDAYQLELFMFEFEQLEAELRRLEALQRASRVRLAQGTVRAEVTQIPSGAGGEYASLVAHSGSDLTRWIRNQDGKSVVVGLSRLKMYPVMLDRSKRMGFARLAKTRISYVRTAVTWPNNYPLAGILTKVKTEFPLAQTKRRNIIFTIRNASVPSIQCRAEMLFDGAELHLVSIRPGKGQRRYPTFEQLAQECEEHLTNPSTQATFFRTFVHELTYKVLGIHNPNADAFFTAHAYRLGLIEFCDVPILLATQT